MANDYDYEDSEKSDKDKDDSSEMEGEQALLPRSIFPKDPKPGKKCTFEVVSVNGDEVAVKYSKSKDDDDKEDDKDDDDTVSVAVKDEDDDPFSSYDSEAR